MKGRRKVRNIQWFHGGSILKGVAIAFFLICFLIFVSPHLLPAESDAADEILGNWLTQEKPTDGLAEQPAGQSAERQAEKKADKLGEKQENQAEKPADKPAEQPTERQAEKPPEKSVENKAEKQADKPADKLTERQAEKPGDKQENQEKPTEGRPDSGQEQRQGQGQEQRQGQAQEQEQRQGQGQGQGQGQAQVQAVDQREIFIKEYVIGPQDLLEIKVFELPELNQTVRVSEDGSITLPLVGNVQVGGLTKDGVEEKLKMLLEARWLKNAQVSVFIKEYQSRRVAVIGAVEKPGMYELIGRLTLLQVISQAGGFKENAADKIYVLREDKDGATTSIAIDLEELLLEGNQKLNIPLMAGDVVNVPVDKFIHVYVFGQVRNPGAIEVKMSKKITVLQAIAAAGGLTEGASKRGVTIKRVLKDGREQKIKVNLNDIIKGKKPDIVLQEGDVVYVPESIF